MRREMIGAERAGRSLLCLRRVTEGIQRTARAAGKSGKGRG